MPFKQNKRLPGSSPDPATELRDVSTARDVQAVPPGGFGFDPSVYTPEEIAQMEASRRSFYRGREANTTAQWGPTMDKMPRSNSPRANMPFSPGAAALRAALSGAEGTTVLDMLRAAGMTSQPVPGSLMPMPGSTPGVIPDHADEGEYDDLYEPNADAERAARGKMDYTGMPFTDHGEFGSPPPAPNGMNYTGMPFTDYGEFGSPPPAEPSPTNILAAIKLALKKARIAASNAAGR